MQVGLMSASCPCVVVIVRKKWFQGPPLWRHVKTFAETSAPFIFVTLPPHSVNPEDDLSLEAASHDIWMPNTMSVPGMLRILDNASHEVDLQHLDHFQAWYADLKNMSSFLCISEYRRQFVMSCLCKSLVQGSDSEKTFETTPPQLHEKCWGHLINFMLAAQPQIHLLRLSWDEHAFAHGTGKQSKGFALEQLSRTLESPWFLAYFEMILKLHGALEALRKFVERCPRHPRHPDPSTDDPPRHIKPCPMNTLRAPELAAGALEECLSKHSAQGASSMLRETAVVLPSAQWAAITSDFQKGMAAISSIIHTKCKFWSQLPYHACALMHWNEDIAVKCAASCIAAWDAMDDAQRATAPSNEVLDLFASTSSCAPGLDRKRHCACTSAQRGARAHGSSDIHPSCREGHRSRAFTY